MRANNAELLHGGELLLRNRGLVDIKMTGSGMHRWSLSGDMMLHAMYHSSGQEGTRHDAWKVQQEGKENIS